ncbi:hypothetical protein [Paracoccus denitrificans]|jgi:hypothetical protein|uniref:Uncharacterized protein n=1 Tax=Paracoccus denitrificans (strain Pd 1222) TaxID=318586 RepID=A1B9G2_PARDP|nr:hypothetical protein [Paracoccus denitrificans]ABL72156.1 hypothetical protein Pden_4090 [Paracoccus denitrificans PD1222]MBB4625929.1 hypothetical protein [Paracoccus denitrificans]MCU7426909.1 hypothetical protein [Paracoccus denitrificans]QAR28731.1 hypothetical protein EO213_20840 [Paracoccus denitrificans]UPV96876.1 hypothetical protein M0K93_20925 [Paracoccus denitrificans]
MRAPVQIPPLNLWPDRDTRQSWRYLEAQTPVDFTQTLEGVGYTAEILILRCGSVIWQAPLDLDAEGYVSVTVPQTVGQTLRSPARIDATYEIRINAPEPELSLVWIGPVSVYEVHS